jgi:uncharacterized membrane protein
MDYRWLVLVHVLAAMAWVGGGTIVLGTLVSARRSRDPEHVDRVMQSLAWADTWLAIPAPLVVLITGIAMVALNGAWSFTQAWILGSIGLMVAYEIVAVTIGARLYRRIDDARRAGTLVGDGHAATMRAWSRLGVLLLAILVAIVGLMVFKPGVG